MLFVAEYSEKYACNEKLQNGFNAKKQQKNEIKTESHELNK